MTHPKARTKPRRRERRDPQDRILLTPKGRALLAALDACLGPVETETLVRAMQQHEQGRATPCAPKRAAPDAPGESNDAPVTPAARPRTPAGKSGAAPLAKEPETDE